MFSRGTPGDDALPEDYTFFIGVKIVDNALDSYYHFATPRSDTAVADVVVWYSTFYFLKKSLLENITIFDAHFVKTGLKNNELVVESLYTNKSIFKY